MVKQDKADPIGYCFQKLSKLIYKLFRGRFHLLLKRKEICLNDTCWFCRIVPINSCRIKKKIFQQTDFTYFCQDLSLFKAP